MTLIVDPEHFPSKKGLKARLDEGQIYLFEPSIMGAYTKRARDFPVGFKGVVANHPKRTKFAAIERREDGWKVS